MKPNMRLTVKLKIVTKYRMIALMRSFVTKCKKKVACSKPFNEHSVCAKNATLLCNGENPEE